MSQPNNALAALIEEAGLTFAGLARRVNDLGRDEVRGLTYDYTAVYRWVNKGERPRTPGVPYLIARALSERLGRKILPSDFGMSDETTLVSRALSYPLDVADTVETIVELGKAELGRADVKRRKVMAAPFVLAALASPSRDWLLASLDGGLDDRGPRKVGMTQIEGIREMFRLFQEMDVMRGGGHARVALVEYMNSYVMPLVRRDHSPDVQLALYEAAAEQAYLVGWMAYDDGQHGLAQRYLIQSLRLAEASQNTVLGAHVLAGMSDQANLLGYPHEAYMLARAGQRAITIEDSPACLADLQILEARALAALPGQSAEAAQAIARAERTFAQVVPDNEPEWARFIDRAYLFGEAAHCFRDIGDPGQISRFAAESAAEAGRQKRARRGALSEAALAVADLQDSQVEAAATRGVKVVRLARQVNSSRCVETVRDLKRRLAPYHKVPEVREFQYEADQLLAPAA
jgi:hypothetical protein